MKIFFFSLLFIASLGLAQAQTITAAEYFIDVDPGQGNGTAIPVPAETTTLTVEVSPAIIANLSPGYHRLACRVQNSSGVWAVTQRRIFFKRLPDQSTPPQGATNLVTGEYFINEDPGQGNGTAFTISGNPATQNINVSPALIAALEPGLHRLAVRVRNDQGKWAISSMRFFEKRLPEPTSGTPLTLAAIEYRWYQNNEAVSAANVLAVAAGETSVSFEQLASLAGLTEGGEYQLVFTPVDSAGNRGISHTRMVTVQTTDENGNGLPDLWEDTYAITDPTADKDGDKVSNLDEFLNGTNPTLIDTDGDGLNDRAEIDLKAAGLDFDPAVANPALAVALQENANGAGLFSQNQFQIFAAGAPVLERSGVGPLTLKFQLKSSTNLQQFQKLSLPEGSLTINDEDEIEYQVTPDAAVKFFSVIAE